MRKILVVLLMAVMLGGCAGINTSVPVNIATDIAFVAALQNNPTYKVPVVNALNTVKNYLNMDVTYDDLIVLINQQLGGKYAYVGLILISYLDTDKPIFTSNLTLFQAWKDGAIQKIDRLILLASM